MVTQDLLKWCDSDAQTLVIKELIANGGNNREAGRTLNMHNETVRRTRRRVEAKAARGGYAPGHFQSGVAPGYVMGKVTVHRDKNGVVQNTWERQSPDDVAAELAMQAAFQAMAAELPRLPASPAPLRIGEESLLNLFTVTDYHMGMLAWDKEAGADWDVSIAESLLYQSFAKLINGAPAAQTAVLAQLGDFLHFDGLKALTPEHGNLLDADSRFQKLVQAVIRVLRRIVDMLLETHNFVHIIMAEGNHDPASSVWLRMMFSTLYENDPRVTVDTSPFPYYVFRFGRTMLGFHHGHLSKNDNLPLLFAARFSKDWGDTSKRYIFVGHRHHEHTKEFPGVKVTQLPTMAAADAYAARGGWLSERQMSRMTFHIQSGKTGEEIVTPDMFAVGE